MATYTSKRDAKKLARTARPGDRLYTIREIRVGYGAGTKVYVEHTVGRSRGLMSAGAMLEGPGHMSVEQLVYSHGPVYTDKPRGMRDLFAPYLQGSDSDMVMPLNEATISAMEKEKRRIEEDLRRFA